MSSYYQSSGGFSEKDHASSPSRKRADSWNHDTKTAYSPVNQRDTAMPPDIKCSNSPGSPKDSGRKHTSSFSGNLSGVSPGRKSSNLSDHSDSSTGQSQNNFGFLKGKASNVENDDHSFDQLKSPKHSSRQINAILSRKLADKQQNVHIMEIKEGCDPIYKHMTVRDLLLYLESETEIIEKEALRLLSQSPLSSSSINNEPSSSKGVRGASPSHDIESGGRGNYGKRNSSSNNNSNSSALNNSNNIKTTSFSAKGNGERNPVTGVGNIKNRDLRRLEYQFNPLGDPVILVRRHIVLISLDPVRAIVMADRILMIVPDGADSLLQLFDKNMNDWAETSGLSFEAKAYEAIFSTVISIHNQDCIELQSMVDSILGEFKRASIIPIERQEQMRILKNRVSGQLSLVVAYRRTLEEILDDEDDLALLNLSLLKPKPCLYDLPLSQEIRSYHEEMEILMESYLVDYNSLQAKLEYLRSQMQSAEELVMLRLDTSRNQLLIADTMISVIACCLALGSFVGSVYGMNLKNHMEEDPHMFHIVLWLTVLGILVLGICTIAYFKITGVLPSESKPHKLFEGDYNYDVKYDKIADFL